MKLIIEPTSVAQLQTFIQDAGKTSNIQLSEEIESYLVYMLLRYLDNPSAFSRALATDLLNAKNQTGEVRKISLIDTGDRSIIVAGLFPKLAKKRLVTVNYYVDLAYSAYDQVANLSRKDKNQKMFQELTRRVIDMVVLLSYTRPENSHQFVAPRAYAEFLNHHEIVH